MTASEFKKRVNQAMDVLSSGDGPSANCGVGFFIGDMNDLISEWESEDHEYSM
jgi:hypothetical protein